jgi:hypothetical protein
MSINKHPVQGRVDQAKGSIKETTDKIDGDTSLEAKGKRTSIRYGRRSVTSRRIRRESRDGACAWGTARTWRGANRFGEGRGWLRQLRNHEAARSQRTGLGSTVIAFRWENPAGNQGTIILNEEALTGFDDLV